MAKLKDLIEADLLAPGPIEFRYQGDCHKGTLLEDGKIKVGLHLFKNPGNWKSHLYPSKQLNGFDYLYSPSSGKMVPLKVYARTFRAVSVESRHAFHDDFVNNCCDAKRKIQIFDKILIKHLVNFYF